jgi:hypothetical protein
MAEPQFELSGDPTIYFYVDKDTDQVDGIYMFSMFGIMGRPKGEDWDVASRKEEPLNSYITSPEKYDIYSFDWSTDILLAKDSDPDDDEEWNPELIKAWGRGEDLSKDDILPFSRMISPGETVDPSEVEPN